MYCPRLFYYQWVENIFIENPDTVAGDRVHKRTDRETQTGPDWDQALQEGETLRSVSLQSEKLGLTGVVDLLHSDETGPRLVDYKKGSPRRDSNGNLTPKEADAVQIVAYAMLLDEAGSPPVSASIYYAAEKQHVPVSLEPCHFDHCRGLITEARALAASGQCPPPLQDDPRCSYCSAYSVCLPTESNYWLSKEAPPPKTDTNRGPRPECDEQDILIVQKPGASVGCRAGHLTVSYKGDVLTRMPAHQVRAVYLYGAVQMTAAATQFCLEHALDVSFFAPSGRFLGLLSGLPASGVDARMGQYRHFADATARLAIAREFVRGKIHNQRVLLMRNACPEKQEIKEMSQLRDRTAKVGSMTELLGLEGRAAAIYFGLFKTMLRQDMGFDFTKRNRRPPRDPVNAILSLSYSMLCKEIAGILWGVGLDPFLGFMHEARYGRPALALDLMEEFRPLVADSVTLSLINRSELKPNDFVYTTKGVFIKDNARRSFWEAWARRLDNEVTHPVFGYRMTYRRMFEVQARQLWRLLRGEASRYEGFTTR